MNFKSVWLIVLTMLMGTASAANINFNGGAVAGCPLTGSTYNCTTAFSMGSTDFVVIAGGYTVMMASFAPSYNQGLTIASTGALQTTGNLSLSNNPANVNIGGATLTAGGSVSLGSSMTINGSIVAASISTSNAVTVTGSVSVTGLADLGSAIKINGNLSGATITTTSPTTLNGSVTASVAFTLASGSSVTGDITAPKVTLSDAGSTVKGNINTTGALYIGSSTTVTGTVNAGSLSMHAERATINGATTVSGDVDMGSGTTINGDLSARNVNTHAENSLINGNAAVNAIYLDWRASVTKTITCTGPGAVGCSCVTKADPNYHPTCGAPPPSAPHHFQINHSGSALTCQAQTVTVIACADASCTTRYTSNVNTTLQPGGQTFTISGGSNSAATVRSTTAGIQTLSASGATNTTTCVNSGGGKPCEMNFQGAGLTVTAANHVSMAPGALVTIEALKDDPAKSVCVPLVTGAASIDMACSYKNPTSGSVNVGFDTKSATCGANTSGAAVSVPVTFDVNGKTTVPLQYADVGKVGVSASYTKGGVSYIGNGDFIAAPDRFLVTAKNAGGTTFGPEPLTSMNPTVFAKAGEGFSLTVTAVNKANNPVPNFGQEISPSQVLVTPTVNKSDDTPVAAPVPASTGSAGGITAVFPSFDKGTSTGSANFDDVGYVKLTVTLKDATTSSTVFYMGEPISAFATTGKQYVSRFIPDHFETELVANTGKSPPANLGTMDCPSPTSSIYPCSGNASFTHSAQGFYIRVKAYNGAATPALAQNYAGALAQPITLQAMQLADNTKSDVNGAIKWNKEGPPLPSPAPTRFTFTGGIGELDMSGAASANLPTYVFTTPHVPVTVYLRAIDTDNASSLRTPPSASKEAVLSMVSGRLLVAKAYGSPTAPLPISVTAQYLMPAGYVYNPLVNDTSMEEVSKHIVFSNCLKGMATYPCTLSPANASAKLKLTQGSGTFTLLAPKPALSRIGMIDVQLKDAAAQPNELFPYLPSTTGTAIFGLYPSGPVIYTREIY